VLWRDAPRVINYRRFFDVNDLAALRMERDDVFDAAHQLVFELIAQGKVDGLRIDHPDGLRDPQQYLARLQQRSPAKTLYVVVEKILARDEQLPPDWPCDGTSGYDPLNMINGVFIDAAREQEMTQIYGDFCGAEADFDQVIYECKRLALDRSFGGALERLAHDLSGFIDQPIARLRDAVVEIVACFPVYRSYITARGVSDADVLHVELAIERATTRNREHASILLEIRNLILLRTQHDREAVLDWIARFQQLTAPVTAKGVEDTAFYRYHRLISLNEVGGEPGRFGVAPGELHAFLDDRQQRFPVALSALSTHDTKRSEDVRARINVLSEIPSEWRDRAWRWREINIPIKRDIHPNDEYLLYQTLIGAWPISGDRIAGYITKALREGKERTSWTDPDQAYEQSVTEFARKVLEFAPFLADFGPFQKRISALGEINSLAQTLIKLTAPGVPDTYQGTELLDFALVDPDNRRPVDFSARAGNLGASAQRKLLVTARSLGLRRAHQDLFRRGKYIALQAHGAHADHIFAFVRESAEHQAITIVPRLVAKLETRVEADIELPAGSFGHLFTHAKFSGTISARELLADFPVALLVRV
jgi:(1->4)-alpha-D-glucan 1-alpha-D-glucosylmutase